MDYPFTFELTRKGVYILTVEGVAVLDGDIDDWVVDSITVEDGDRSYTLDPADPFEAALVDALKAWLYGTRGSHVETHWLENLPDDEYAAVVEASRYERYP